MKKAYHSRRFLADVMSAEPRRVLLVLALLIASSLFAGIALTLLFPLLASLGFAGDGNAGDIARQIAGVLSSWGIGSGVSAIALLFVTMVVLQHVLLLAQAWIAAGLQSGLTARWRRELTVPYLRTEWLYFARSNVGELAHALNVETSRGTYLINYGCQLGSLCLTASIYFVIALYTSFQVTLVLMLGGALVLGVSKLIVRHRARTSALQGKFYSHYAAKSSEVLGGMKLISAAGGDEAVRQLLWPLIDVQRTTERKISTYPALLRSCFEVSAIIALLLSLVLAVTVLGNDGATVMLIAALFLRLYPRISTIQQYVHQIVVAIPYYAIVADAMDAAHAAAERSTDHNMVTTWPIAPPSLVLKDLSVSYDRRPALEGISLTIPARHTVAIVGPSGAGKSTLVDTLLRLVPVRSGQILIDGTELDRIDVAAWRAAVGYVPQDKFLFNATIRENIGFAQPGARFEEIREAARKARLADFIASLPEGYDTVVGDRGVMLSGGQRQRVGLARALLRGKKLLILDETTSALDSETEAAVMEDIASLHGQITIIIIAHRLSTLRVADQIFVLDKGRLVEAGSWQSLIAKAAFSRSCGDCRPRYPACSPGVARLAVMPNT